MEVKTIDLIFPNDWTGRGVKRVNVAGYEVFPDEAVGRTVERDPFEVFNCCCRFVRGKQPYFDTSSARFIFGSNSHACCDVSGVGFSETEDGVHLMVICPCELDGKSRKESEYKEEVRDAVGIIAAIGGRRAAFRKLYDYDLAMGTGQFSAPGPVYENPIQTAPPQTDLGSIGAIGRVSANIIQKAEPQRERMKTSLHWFYKSTCESRGTDSFVECWIALEAMMGGNDDIVEKVAGVLAGAYSTETGKAKAEFAIGRLYGKRCDIVHEGMRHLPERLDQYLFAVYSDVLCAMADLPSLGKVRAFLATKEGRRAYEALTGTAPMVAMEA